MKKQAEYIVQEGNRMIMYIGHPNDKSSTRIDVTMAVNIGMKIASKDYLGVEVLTI